VFDSVWGVIPPPPERNTAWNKGRKYFHCLRAPNKCKYWEKCAVRTLQCFVLYLASDKPMLLPVWFSSPVLLQVSYLGLIIWGTDKWFRSRYSNKNVSAEKSSSCCSLCKKIIRDREPWTILLHVHLSLNASVSFSKLLNTHSLNDTLHWGSTVATLVRLKHK